MVYIIRTYYTTCHGHWALRSTRPICCMPTFTFTRVPLITCYPLLFSSSIFLLAPLKHYTTLPLQHSAVISPHHPTTTRLPLRTTTCCCCFCCCGCNYHHGSAPAARAELILLLLLLVILVTVHILISSCTLRSLKRVHIWQHLSL